MTNNQAIGYMLLACKNTKLSLEDLQEIYSNMCYLFDMKTCDEAEKQGFDWYYEILEKTSKNDLLKSILRGLKKFLTLYTH